MRKRQPSNELYQALFGPWLAVAAGSQTVIALRLSQLPLMWLTQPRRADREARRMVDEKLAAWQEWQQVLWQMPLRFWADMLSRPIGTAPATAVNHALRQAGRRGAQPYQRRVRANRRRLGR